MYQIKINSYTDIITDNLNLDIRNFYNFIDEVSNITYVNKQGFILEYQKELYFFRFTKEEISYFNTKQYRQLPFTYQRLIIRYHILNGIIESESEINEFIEMMLYNKPVYSKILKSNIKNKKYALFKLFKKSLEEYKESLQEWNNKLQNIISQFYEETDEEDINDKTYKKRDKKY